jgi:uncharacterized damage-inducible protein DinB
MTTNERDDLLDNLTARRGFLLRTVQGLTDDQARHRSTVSELTLGGLIKHVARVEKGWVDFILEGPSAIEMTEDSYADHAAGFVLREDETLAGVMAEYEKTAQRTDELVRTLPDLGATQPLPKAPWFAPGAVRSARAVFMHIATETAQHAGHADILREAIDGQKTMG